MRARSLTLLLAACLLGTGCDDDATKTTGTTATAPEETTASITAPPATTTAAPATSSAGPRATVRDYFAALAGRDGAKACSLLTAGAQRKAIAAVQASKKTKFKGCAEALEAVVGALSDMSAQAGKVQITKATVSGDRATVAVERGVSDFQLQRLAGRWYLAGPIG